MAMAWRVVVMALPPHGVTDRRAKNSSSGKIGISNSNVGSALYQKEIEHTCGLILCYALADSD